MLGDAHVEEELVDFITGALDLETSAAVARHLEGCPVCTEALIDTAFVHGNLERQRAVSYVPAASEVAHPTELPALDVSRLSRRKGPSRVLSVAAAAVLVVGLAIGLVVARGGKTTPSPSTASFALAPLSAPKGAWGTVLVTRANSLVDLQVTTAGLAPPNSQEYLEAWLLDPATNKMLPLGMVRTTGPTGFTVPIHLMAGYSAVDISLQQNDGNPVHSPTSLLRGVMPTLT